MMAEKYNPYYERGDFEYEPEGEWAEELESESPILCPPKPLPSPGNYVRDWSRSSEGGHWYTPKRGDTLWKVAEREIIRELAVPYPSGSAIRTYMQCISAHKRNRHLRGKSSGLVTRAFLVIWNRENRCKKATRGPRGYATLYLPPVKKCFQGDDISFSSELQYFIGPYSMPSCEPGKFKSGKLDVVRWWKRTTPGKREIPKDKKLAILSRGRIRLPIESIKWLLDEGKKRYEWVSRLPDNLDTLFPEVDVTIELWMAIKGRVTAAEDTTIFSAWNIQRLQELTNCKYLLGRSYTADQKTSVEYKLRLGDLGLNLNNLYKKGGVPFSGHPTGKDATSIAVFLIYIYVTFPKDLEKFLKHPVIKKPPELGKLIPTANVEILAETPAEKIRLQCLRKQLARAFNGVKIDDRYWDFLIVTFRGQYRPCTMLGMDYPQGIVKRKKPQWAIKRFKTLVGSSDDPKVIAKAIKKLHDDVLCQINALSYYLTQAAGNTDRSALILSDECVDARFLMAQSRKTRPESIYKCFTNLLELLFGKICSLPK
jgi:hypothetical protein